MIITESKKAIFYETILRDLIGEYKLFVEYLIEAGFAKKVDKEIKFEILDLINPDSSVEVESVMSDFTEVMFGS